MVIMINTVLGVFYHNLRMEKIPFPKIPPDEDVKNWITHTLLIENVN